MNNGGIIASDLANNYHVYSMNWSPNQISFLLDGVIYYTYNPTTKDPNTWPFDKEQFILLNVAMGGWAAPIPANFVQSSMSIDYVRIFQNTTVDTQAPTNFTATVGIVTGTSVQLLLNGTDNSGNMAYTITYSGGTITVYNPSGIQKSVVIPNLSPNTNYTFSVRAADVAGNQAGNNPIVLNATTITNPECIGTDTQASEGSFTLGYNYTFQTIGPDVKITFELLDSKVGLVAFLRSQSPFAETQMTNVSGQIFTQTITGQTIGSTITYAVKFAFAGGLSVTKYFSYVVGNNSCSLGLDNPSEAIAFYFQNPANDFVNITSNSTIDKVEIYNIIGNNVLKSTSTNRIDISSLPKGVYLLTVYSGTKKSIKKMIVN